MYDLNTLISINEPHLDNEMNLYIYPEALHMEAFHMGELYSDLFILFILFIIYIILII